MPAAAVCKPTELDNTVSMRLTGSCMVLWFSIACLAPAIGAALDPVVDLERLPGAILVETNRERALHGLNTLQADARLACAADRHVRFLVLIGSLQHDSPLPGCRTVRDRVASAGVRPRDVGENLALTSVRSVMLREKSGEGRGIETVIVGTAAVDIGATATRVVRQWMESPGHRANVLNPGFTRLGCAVQTGAGPFSGVLVYSVQVFAGP